MMLLLDKFHLSPWDLHNAIVTMLVFSAFSKKVLYLISRYSSLQNIEKASKAFELQDTLYRKRIFVIVHSNTINIAK